MLALAQSKSSINSGCNCCFPSVHWDQCHLPRSGGAQLASRPHGHFFPRLLTEPLCTRFMDFVCKNRQQCLFHSMVCDGIIQCRDGSDEDPAFAGCCEWAGRAVIHRHEFELPWNALPAHTSCNSTSEFALSELPSLRRLLFSC